MSARIQYCHRCAFKISQEFKFCPSCGSMLIRNENGPSTAELQGKQQQLSSNGNHRPSLPGFTAFKRKKEEERSSFSVRGFGKRKKVAEKPVVIHVGVMKNKQGEIKRGENLPVKLLPSAKADDILKVARQKHCAFNKRFNDRGTYKLAYKDGSEVVNVPGTEEPFSLKRYKEESGFNYARITLYLQPTRITFNEVLSVLRDDNDGSGLDPSESEEDDLPPAAIEPLSPLSPEEGSAVAMSPNPALEMMPPATLGFERATIVHPQETCVNEQLSPIPGTSNSNNCVVPDDGKVECPTCFVKFPASEVSQHADECAEEYWSRTDSDVVGHTTKVSSDQKEKADVPTLKTEIKKIKETNLDKSRILVTVRRNSIWSDFKRAREKYYRPDSALKVTFSGEPAIDTGGPKREFFAGEFSCLTYSRVVL